MKKMKFDNGSVYSGFGENKGESPFIYIGGKYYDESAQIHLTLEDAKHLRSWFNKVLKKKHKRKTGSKPE